MTTGSHEQVLKLSTENTVICKGLPKGSGMCEHQEGQRGPVTDGKGGTIRAISICEPSRDQGDGCGGGNLDIPPNTLQCHVS